MPGQRFATYGARDGMVCSIDHLASSAGVAILRAGGSAVDAAVGASAVLTVTAPDMCGMGGDLFALVHEGGAAPDALNASGRAGSGATPERLRTEGHERMPFTGDIRSVPVPGCVDGWLALHERYGRLPLDEVLAAAIGYAADGFPCSPRLSALIPLVADLTGADELGDPPPAPGDLVRRPGPARALQAVVADGRDGFYRGEFGESLLALGRGEFTSEDLEAPQAEWVAPLELSAFGHQLWTIPPNSQGYLTLAGCWIADHLALPATDDIDWAHLLIETAKVSARDRTEVLAEHADPHWLLGRPRLDAALAAVDRRRATALPGPLDAGDTIYLCVVDRDHCGVSLIQSNATAFGSSLIAPGTGIFLHNRGVGFSLSPGHPAEYAPGRRPPSTLSPAAVTRPDGSLRGVVGTMGGDSQPQILLQVITRWLGAGASPGRAIGAPRWVLGRHDGRGFDTWTDPSPLEVWLERDCPAGWPDGLADRGHRVRLRNPLDLGMGHAHLIDVRDNGTLAGASDPRASTGAAQGY